MKHDETRSPMRLVARALVGFVLALGLAFASATPAQALTVDKATARPNSQSGDELIGGRPTRLTWEGTVGDDEEVAEVTLELPEGGSFADSSTRITVLEGLTRISVEGEAAPGDGSLVVSFAEPIPAGSLLRLEVEGTTFPAEGGEVSVGGAYVDGAGAAHELDASKPIAVISNTRVQAIVDWLDQQPWVEAWNSVPFLGMFLKPQLLVSSMVTLLDGWLLCLLIVVAAYPFAILLGLAFAFMKMSKHRLLRAIATVYINVLRGTPLFLQIYIMFFGLPMVGVNIDNNVLGVAVIAINSSAYLSEIFRAGIESIPAGQYEAAASLGMNRAQTMAHIILPQTVRRVLPTITSDFITSYKDTSLLSSVGVMELMMFAKNAVTVAGNITPYVSAAIFYLIVTLPLIKVVSIVEERLGRAEHGRGRRPKAGDAALATSLAVSGMTKGGVADAS